MANQIINVGTTANDGTGDKVRDAFIKVNSNFAELYDEGGANITVNNPVTSTETTLDEALSDLNTGGGGTPTLQEVLDNDHDLVSNNNFQGTGAGINNTGNDVNAFGYSAAEENTGAYINAFGYIAGTSNTGDNNNFLGSNAGGSNTGSSVNAMGAYSLQANTGNNVNAFGDSVGNANTFNNVNLFGENATANEDGQTVLSKDGTIMARISTTDLTDTRKYNLPDADGTLALTSDIPTLNEVTTEGNETTNPIKVIDTGASSAQLQQNGIYFVDIVNEGTTNLVFEASSISNQEVFIKNESGTLALLSDIPDTSNFVPYTGATANVDLGTHKLLAEDLDINHASGSGDAATITKGGNGEALKVVKTSGSGNAASITGGVTLLDELHLTTDLADAYISSAPTWNAKQNALAYTPYRFVQTSQTAHTGTTAETILATATIPAGAFNSNDVMKVLLGANKTTNLGTYTLRLRVNTTNTISGAPTIAIYIGSASIQSNVVMRNYHLIGGNLLAHSFSTTAITDIFVSTGLSSTALNPSNQFFIFFTITLGNAGDSIIGNMLSIHN